MGSDPRDPSRELNHRGLGLPGADASVLEISHRSEGFERMIEEAEAKLVSSCGSRRRIRVPGGYPLTMQVSVRLSPGISWMSLSI